MSAHPPRIVIAIDGLAASGKSSLGTELAKRLGYAFVSTGLLYRGIGYLALQDRVDPDQEAEVTKLMTDHRLEFVSRAHACALSIDGKELDQELKLPEVSDYTSRISVHPAVRKALLDSQRSAFLPNNVVVEGRDIGTVVFPEAQVKFFITADQEVRTARRRKQSGLSAGDSGDKREIQIRDLRDTSRAHAPTVAAKDAVVVDNSQRSFDQTLEFLVQTCIQRLK